MELKEKTKVLFLITKSNWGGAQRYVYDLATSLPQSSYEVVVVLGGTGILHQRLRDASIRTISLSTLTRDVSLQKDWHTFTRIRNIIKEEQPNILHVNSSKAGGLGALAGRFARVPAIIYTAHGWAFNEDRSWLNRQVVAFFHWCTVLLAHRTIAVSQAIKNQFHWPFAQSRMTVIHNAIAAPQFFPRDEVRHKLQKLLPTLARFHEDPWGVTIAELHPVKQHDVTIRAVASLRDQGIPYRHVIIGTGEQTTQLAALIAALDLEDHVFMTGHITDAARWLCAFDVFVLSSRSEALGYVLLEALAAKLPIVASNVGGIPEIVPASTPHTLVASGNVAALGNAIKHTLATPKDTAPAETTTTLDNMVAKTIALYDTHLHRH